jgi:nickel transport protein
VKRSIQLCRGLGVAAALIAGAAWSHEVRLETSLQSAVVVRLTYADGQPFAFESYELYRPGKDVPEQVGRTDAQGLVVFMPASHAQWRLKAFSADGHGVDQVLTTPPETIEGTVEGVKKVAAVSASTPRALLLASGI